MILSVSRRTDIPAFYSQWFMNRIREGFVYVRNPFNANQISRINLSPDVIDCIVFWTKDPRPLMDYLPELDNKGYDYYFQITITPYHDDLEVHVNDKKAIAKSVCQLSDILGKDRVIVRYDPILFTERYDKEYHKKAFRHLCTEVGNYTHKIIISFLDDYRKVERNMKSVRLRNIEKGDMFEIAELFATVAKPYGIAVETCAEAINLADVGVSRGKCIDGDLIEKITGYEIQNKNKLDANREHCGCMKCVDIGQYDTCVHGCLYCYANVNKQRAIENCNAHDPDSPILTGVYDESMVTVRKDIKSYRISETSTNVLEGEQLKIDS